MKLKLTELSQRFVTALRIHLKPGTRATVRSALELGSQAVACGLKMFGGSFAGASAPRQVPPVWMHVPLTKVRRSPLKKSGKATLECL